MTSRNTLLAAVLLAAAGTLTQAQTTEPQNAQPATTAPDQQPAPEAAPPPTGTVLFQSHGEPPATPAHSDDQQPTDVPVAKPTGPELTDADRSAIAITSYDLDARLTPAGSNLTMRAELTLRNQSTTPLTRVALQISSTLRWQSATLISGPTPAPLPLAQHLIDTDADHTGKAAEAILELPSPLAPGKSITIDTFYSGPIAASGDRLERIGASSSQAGAADWDEVTPTATDLRGFGDVLWYPVAAPQLFLGEGAQLFDAIDRMKVAEANTPIRLRLAIEYRGEAPTAAYFCGRRQSFKALPDNADAPVASGTGIATADFPAEPLGYRLPNLFVVAQNETMAAPLPEISSSTTSSSGEDAPAVAGPETGPPMLAIATADDTLIPPLAAEAERIAPVIQQWFGPRPLTALTIIDHEGQPFEDGPLLVAPAAALGDGTASEALAHSLTHAWVQTGQPWMDEGLAQFASVLWTEHEHGRDKAIAEMNDLLQPLALSEPDFDSAAAAHAPDAKPGQPLISATSEIYYRRKAAAVWWMLSGITGTAPLRDALSAWRTQPLSHDTPAAQAIAFQHLLEKTSGKDLGWFFNDWVLHDRGLPDLSIVDVTPRMLPAGKGHDTGWLVAVTIRNAGAPEVEIPVVIRSGTFSVTKRMLVPGFGDVTDRVLVESEPTQVLVNDGGTPELRTSLHTRDIVSHQQ